MSEKRKFVEFIPNLLVLVGIMVGGVPYLMGSIYTNIFLGLGIGLLFLAWIIANVQKKVQLQKENRWKDQVRAMMAMSLCVLIGLAMLTYYEVQMPKYNVALIEKEMYRVPPQLNKKQLRELGAECNTYGDTLCSHAVFAKIVKLDPRDYFALANLAMAQSHLGFHQNAIVNFENAIHNGAKKYDVYKFYGHSLMALNKKNKAIEAYSTSLAINPYQESLREKVAKLSKQ